MVTLSSDEAQILASRLGYSDPQDLLDDLAMGLIPPIGASVAPPSVTPLGEGSGKSTEVAWMRSNTDPRMQSKEISNIKPTQK